MTNANSIAAKIKSMKGLADLQIDVIPNGLINPLTKAEACQHRVETRKRLGVADDEFLIGCVGRLHKVKNFEMAILALNEIHTNAPHTKLLLVGDGPERKRLETITQNFELEQNVIFAGEQSNAWPFYAAMDIFANTSYSEGMSQSIVEAMAMGKAMLVTDVGDSAALVQGAFETGKVIQPNDRKAFTHLALELEADSNQRKRFGINSEKTFINLYQLPKMINSFESLYSQIAQRTRVEK